MSEHAEEIETDVVVPEDPPDAPVLDPIDLQPGTGQPGAGEPGDTVPIEIDKAVPNSTVPDSTVPDGAVPDDPAPESTGIEAGVGARYVPASVVDVEVRLPSTTPMVVLEELDPPYRRISIAVDLSQGVAIAHALGVAVTPKPLTHELFAMVIEGLGATIETVRITDRAGGAYFAEIVLSTERGVKSFSCRPSDALALALRHRLPCPITIAEAVFDSE